MVAKAVVARVVARVVAKVVAVREAVAKAEAARVMEVRAAAREEVAQGGLMAVAMAAVEGGAPGKR